MLARSKPRRLLSECHLNLPLVLCNIAGIHLNSTVKLDGNINNPYRRQLCLVQRRKTLPPLLVFLHQLDRFHLHPTTNINFIH